MGSIAVPVLAKAGYDVTAITGTDDRQDYLRQLGAREAVAPHVADGHTSPEKATWAGAVDAVVGDVLGWLIRTAHPWGSIASCRLTGGVEACPMDLRRAVW